MKKMNKNKFNVPLPAPAAGRKSSEHPVMGKYLFMLALYLLLFSLVLTAVLGISNAGFRKSDSEINEAVLDYMVDAFPASVDTLYRNKLDDPMEKLFDSSIFISFFFSTPNYPAGPDLLSRLGKDLTAFTDSSEYISAAVVYAASTNTFVSSRIRDSLSEKNILSYMDEIIYSYNSNTLEKIQSSGGEHHTFLFQYKDYIILSKDLTTVSGVPHATLFTFFDPDQFASLLYSSCPSILPYSISVYDPHQNLLFTNAENEGTTAQNQPVSPSSTESGIELAGNVYRIHCSSDAMPLRYVLEISRDLMPVQPADPLPSCLASLSAILLMILLAAGLVFARFRRPAARLFHILNISEADSSLSFRDIFTAIITKAAAMAHENAVLREIVSATSAEALSSLFARLISGQQAGEDDIRITLNNTGYGFRPDDIYVVGILQGTGLLESDKKYRILNLLNAVFDKYKGKNECSTFVFPFDEESFVIIVSFSSDTSIAKGKTKVNELTRLLEENLEFSNLNMPMAFGHMYNSILDLSFSYNEAFKALHYMAGSSVNRDQHTRQEPLPAESVSPAADSLDSLPDQPGLPPDESQETMPEGTPSSELIERRAFQIAQLISEGRESSVSSLIERTIEDIFKEDRPQNQRENSKRLVSAVIDNMISYPFVNDSHLSDVYSILAHEIDDGAASDKLQPRVREAINTLCTDFSKVLKKQRNPYIVAAQEYIAAHYGNPELSLEEIAEGLKIAPNYLSTIFSRNLGKKLFAYVNEYRLEKSIDQLIHTDKTINDISVENGFGSARNYIRIFKKYKETTPGVYRKQHTAGKP